MLEEMHEAMQKTTTTPEPPKPTLTTTTTTTTTEKSVHDSIMAEHIQEMAALQRSLLLQQHKAQMANLERQKDAVRDEIEQVANMLIHSRGTRQNVRSDGSNSFQHLKEMFIRQGQPRMAQLVSSKMDALPSHQAVAWHQRFTDNFRLRKLQHKALRLRGPVLMPTEKT